MASMAASARAPLTRTLRRHERAAVLAASFVVLALLRHTHVWVGDRIVWPLLLGAIGVSLVWRPSARAGAEERHEWRNGSGALGGGEPSARVESPPRRWSVLGRHVRTLVRVTIGGLLVLFASAGLLHAVMVLRSLGDAVGAAAIVATTLGLLVAPWFVRLGGNLAAERAARIREQERAEVAAHLHDSVLQTLALIQKRAGEPREVAALARRQERELRRWLFERPSGAGAESVRTALERAAAEVEELHGVPIEAVVVGDGRLDGRLEALVGAAREAMTNAAKFAGSGRVDLYAEVSPERVEAFVRDRGVGFQPDAIPEDRRGVRDSIVGRVERHGGRVCIRSAAGEGTEVELAMECARL